MIEITAPDGSVIRFPEGTPEETIVSVLSGLSPEPPREQLRAAAQGATFGLSDEAIAAVTNPVAAARAAFGDAEGGAGYYDRLASERGKLEAYRQARPLEALGYELGGAAVPTVAATLFTGGAATPIQGPLITRAISAAPRLMKEGAAFGSLYGAGTAEGGIVQRLKGAATGAATGAVMAPAVGAATYPVIGASRQIVDYARRTLGARGSKAVEAELQRLAEQTGETTDEIVQRIARGEIMADNATLRMAVRAMMARGGEGEKMVRAVYEARPQKTREQAMAEIQRYLGGTTDENVLRGATQAQREARTAEGEAFKELFAAGGGGAVSDDVAAAMADVLQRSPGAASELQRFTRAQTNTTPYFNVDEAGAVTFTRQPTVQEAEILRRFLAGKADEAYRAGSPWGEVYKEMERGVRAPLDESVSELAATRARWAKLSSEKAAFEEGRKLLGKSPDEIEILVEDMLARGPDGEALLGALRSGAMTALRAKVSGAGGTSLMGNLFDPNRKEGAMLRALLPPDVYDDVATKVGVAAQAQAARGDIIKGPSTALVQAADKRLGADINADDITGALSGNFTSILRVGSKVIKQAAPDLSDRDRTRVLNVLLSEDPEFVRRALSDESGAAALAAAVNRAADRIRSGATGAGVAGGAMLGNQAMQGR